MVRVLFRWRTIVRRVFQVMLVTDPALRPAVGDTASWRRPLASSLLLARLLVR
jgi:hypothetical protein